MTTECCVGECAWVCEAYGCSGLCSCVYVSSGVCVQGVLCVCSRLCVSIGNWGRSVCEYCVC